MNTHILSSFGEAQTCLDTFMNDQVMMQRVNDAVDLIAKTLSSDGKVIACGNGGSMSDSMHFAEELSGRFRKDRKPLPAIALSDPAHITCVANDFGFEYIFSRQVEALGKNGDVLLAISTSGNSPNVLYAAKVAKEQEMKVIGLLGHDGGKLKELCDFPIIVPGKNTDRMQELHIKIIHIMIECVERKLFPELYKD